MHTVSYARLFLFYCSVLSLTELFLAVSWETDALLSIVNIA